MGSGLVACEGQRCGCGMRAEAPRSRVVRTRRLGLPSTALSPSPHGFAMRIQSPQWKQRGRVQVDATRPITRGEEEAGGPDCFSKIIF